MSSASEYNDTESAQEVSDVEANPPSRPSSRRQSRTPLTPRKRRRLESVDPSRIRNYHLEGKYNDAYRVLYNEHVNHAAARFEPLETTQHYATQIGASTWSSDEQAVFFAALERLGKGNVAGVAKAVGTKSIPETQELLLLLHDAAVKQGDTKVTLRDVPAAVEVDQACNEQLDTLAEALAWYQDMHEASQEQAKFGQYWLITSDIARKIESALFSDSSRAASSVPPSGAETPGRGGRVIVGACTSCKLHKQKCDRGTPCGNCVRRKLDECVYPKLRGKPLDPGQSTQQSVPVQTIDCITQAIPEAQLLNADTMLTLSRTVFMNRSPTIPSPWPHWSEIVSDLTTEPAIYRSAFNDFHTLVVSVTKRLMQTAITQATSRLRSQRRRSKKGTIPLVKRRDVLAALDVVGMKKNGQERWQGVARRCALRVVQGKPERASGRNPNCEVSWDEVEKIMAPGNPFIEPLATDIEISDGPATSFKRRAARSGTPLPMEGLALSDSQTESDIEDSNAGSDVSMLDDLPRPFTRQPTQPRDLRGKYASVAPTLENEQLGMKHITLEEFDHEASRLEQRALLESLNIQTPGPGEQEIAAGVMDQDDVEFTEKVVTDVDGWRSWTEYHHEWEEFDDPVPQAQFTANRKPHTPIPQIAGVFPTQPNIVPDDNDNENISSSDDSTTRHWRKPLKSVELQARDPRAYAALQERTTRLTDSVENDEDLDEENTSNTGSERDHPTQSIEVVDDTPRTPNRDDSMDWDTYMDL
ncbi:hypothetical protein J1614_006423 [Plenodomus biglobosus]|nr:hypothetical protein J1614_006423 [Plenodomus biglobosus]